MPGEDCFASLQLLSVQKESKEPQYNNQYNKLNKNKGILRMHEICQH